MGKIYSFIVYCKISSAKIAPGSASFIDDVTFCLKFLFVFFLFGKAVLFEMASSSFMKVCVGRCKKIYMIQWNLFFGTPLFKGHLYSRDTSIHRTQNMVPEKRSHHLCIYYFYLRNASSLETWVLPAFRGHLSTQKVTDHKHGWYLLVYSNHHYGSFHN